MSALGERRAGFEEAYHLQFGRLPQNWNEAQGKYFDAHGQGAWWAWCAALGVIENDPRRTAFEAWADAHHLPLQRMGRTPHYEHADTQGAWIGWNAALDSVVIELPAPDSTDANPTTSTDCDSGFARGVSACRVAINAAGLKVKP
ncbi:hypothetical protein K32_48830 [Kaistia sp. 32K]|uniref:hypothetical protein n=1 Tax=Kaistia sp. 32K TaxID=2795690 RepID=UPI001916535D|nr:hypothetical protein [Kaistia sp. 32K]BCP56266.1 hypothetical protein K32_48830 [Kaistia sp. 32K]